MQRRLTVCLIFVWIGVLLLAGCGPKSPAKAEPGAPIHSGPAVQPPSTGPTPDPLGIAPEPSPPGPPASKTDADPAGSAAPGEQTEEPPVISLPVQAEFQVTLNGVFTPVFYAAGATGKVGTGSFRLTVRLPAPLSQEAAMRAVSVDGARFDVSGWHEPTGALGLRVDGGAPGELITVAVSLGEEPQVLQLLRVEDPTVVLERQVEEKDQWEPVNPWDTASPGSGTLRLRFSKPVDQEAVVDALLTSQTDPVRGLFRWVDPQTLLWQIPELPSRLFFLLNGARDTDGLPLPGGLPVIRVGSPAVLNLLMLDRGIEGELMAVPADPIRARLLPDGKQLVMTAWKPGRTHWDWTQADYTIHLQTFSVTEGAPPEDPRRGRIPADLTATASSPDDLLLVGFRGRDLILIDISSGRERRYTQFLEQESLPSAPVWSPDGKELVALDGPDLVALHVETWERRLLVSNLPADAGVRLSRSESGRFVLVGSLVVDLAEKSFVRLPGNALSAKGFWEPEGERLVYSAADWAEIYLYDPVTDTRRSVGKGLLVGWESAERLYVIRWADFENRYHPPGGMEHIP